MDNEHLVESRDPSRESQELSLVGMCREGSDLYRMSTDGEFLLSEVGEAGRAALCRSSKLSGR